MQQENKSHPYIKIYYGEGVGTYSYIALCDDCAENKNLDIIEDKCRDFSAECQQCNKTSENNIGIYEFCTSSHQICFSNDFQPIHKKIDGWYMGCIFLRGEKLQNVSREEMKNILEKTKKYFGDRIEAPTGLGLIEKIENRMNDIIEYMYNVYEELYPLKWEWSDITKTRENFNKF